MKSYSLILKYIVIPTIGLTSMFWGGFVVLDNFAVSRAKSVVAPIEVEVQALNKAQIQYYKSIDDNIKLIQQQNSVMYAEMLKRNNP